jgi:hypothetical protein
VPGRSRRSKGVVLALPRTNEDEGRSPARRVARSQAELDGERVKVFPGVPLTSQNGPLLAKDSMHDALKVCR